MNKKKLPEKEEQEGEGDNPEPEKSLVKKEKKTNPFQSIDDDWWGFG